MSWENVPLGKCCEIVSGATPRRNVPEYWGGDIAWTTPKDISGIEGAILFDTPEYISKAGYKSCSARILPKDSILFSSGAPIGLVAIAGREMCTNQGFKSLIPGPDVDSTYLYYCMKKYANRIAALGSGATFKEVSKEKVSNFPIPLPPLKEQKRIAAILYKADAIRRKRRQAIQLADEFLRSVFLDMFGDPASNPKSFPLIQLDSIFSKAKPGVKCGPFGSALKRNEYEKAGVPVWTMDNIQENEFRESGCLFISQEKYNELKSYFVENGDILISRAGTVGKMCVVHNSVPQSIISTNLIRLSLDASKIKPIYFTTMMNSFKGRVGQLKTGAEGAYTFMNTSVLKKLRIPLPQIELQEKFANIHERVMDLKAKFRDKYLDNLFNSLSQRAFRGEL